MNKNQDTNGFPTLYVDRQGRASFVQPVVPPKPVVGPTAFMIGDMVLNGAPPIAVIHWLAERVTPSFRYVQPQIKGATS